MRSRLRSLAVGVSLPVEQDHRRRQLHLSQQQLDPELLEDECIFPCRGAVCPPTHSRSSRVRISSCARVCSADTERPAGPSLVPAPARGLAK